jgi:hypothetical protein
MPKKKANPKWLTVTPKKGSTLTMEQRKYLEELIVKHCDIKATLEKNAAKPQELQMQRFDKDRCWHAAYSACARHILKYL